MPPEKCIVFSDAFCIGIWEDFFKEDGFENIVLDTHQYLTLDEMMDPAPNTIEKYKGIIARIKSNLQTTSQKLPVIVGEWCLQTSALGLNEMSAEEKRDFYNTLYQLYMDAFRECEGSFYWSYKLNHVDPSMYAWDAQRCINNKWMKGV